MWRQRNEKGIFLENPTGTGKQRRRPPGLLAMQMMVKMRFKKSQMQNPEEQLSTEQDGGMGPADRGLGVLSNSASTDPSRGTGESQVLGSSSRLHCLLRGAVR